MQTQNINELTEAEKQTVSGGASLLFDSNYNSISLNSSNMGESVMTDNNGHILMPFITLGLHEDGGMFTTF